MTDFLDEIFAQDPLQPPPPLMDTLSEDSDRVFADIPDLPGFMDNTISASPQLQTIPEDSGNEYRTMAGSDIEAIDDAHLCSPFFTFRFDDKVIEREYANGQFAASYPIMVAALALLSTKSSASFS